MKKPLPSALIILIISINFLFLMNCQSSVRSLRQLQTSIELRFDTTTSGNFALAFKNLSDSTDKIFINDGKMFHAASTMKVPVLIEAFKQIAEGKFSLSDSLLVQNHFKSIVDSSVYQLDSSEDSYQKLYQYIGKRRSMQDLLLHMITYSSNLATNLIIEKLGAKNVMATMHKLGADSIKVLRGVEDIKAYKKGLNNVTDARDLLVLFEKLGKGEVVSPEASKQMLTILKQQKFNEMIPAKLPASVEVAHKTGWITKVRHDAGLVLLPGGKKYVLVMLSGNAPDSAKVNQMFADISKDIYDYILNKP